MVEEEDVWTEKGPKAKDNVEEASKRGRKT